MTTTSEMVFEVKCVKCGTIYRSELAHVGKSIQCACGSVVKIVPPLDSLTDIAGTATKSTSPKRSTRNLIPWFAVGRFGLYRQIHFGKGTIKSKR
jgi:DNA-directed RNA polymerase subunit RPC12/RpoP